MTRNAAGTERLRARDAGLVADGEAGDGADDAADGVDAAGDGVADGAEVVGLNDADDVVGAGDDVDGRNAVDLVEGADDVLGLADGGLDEHECFGGGHVCLLMSVSRRAAGG